MRPRLSKASLQFHTQKRRPTLCFQSAHNPNIAAKYCDQAQGRLLSHPKPRVVERRTLLTHSAPSLVMYTRQDRPSDIAIRVAVGGVTPAYGTLTCIQRRWRLPNVEWCFFCTTPKVVELRTHRTVERSSNAAVNRQRLFEVVLVSRQSERDDRPHWKNREKLGVEFEKKAGN